MENPSFKKKRVLLVEDDEMLIFILKRYSRKMELDFTVVRSGQQALEMIKINKYDVAIMDFGLPDMSGLDLAKTIKTKLGERLSKLPIIGFSGVMEVQENYAEFFDGFISKNINQTEMFEKLSVHLK